MPVPERPSGAPDNSAAAPGGGGGGGGESPSSLVESKGGGVAQRTPSGPTPQSPEDSPTRDGLTAGEPGSGISSAEGSGGSGSAQRRSWGGGALGVPTRIGRYEIVRVLASGGMGTVFEAVQDQPKRVVALKLLRAGIASPQALRRFEYESQILGRLRHPGIAQVYEAGTHEQASALGGDTVSLPYIAIEYVPGARAITDYAESRRLNPRARLALFALVCDAVHHGHQRGVIHRDLKPGNILVDSTGQPKVIDFGVARTMDDRPGALRTEEGQVVGTIQYMSPEQVELESEALDVRSDVYALGVSLFEALTGRPPYDLTDTPVYRATKIIREQAPSRLSQFVPSLRGDVETIVLKALEKDRERRYQSALELKADIERYLRGEPISARAPSVVYQVRVLARRHRVAFAAAGVVALALAAGAVVSTMFGLRANRARHTAEQASAVAERQRAEADRALALAQREADNAEASNRVLREVITMATPARAGGRAVTVREAVEATADRIPSLTAGRPGAEAAARSAVGETLRTLGQFAAAETQLRAAVDLLRRERGADDPDTLAAMIDLSSSLMEQGKHAEAIAIDRETVALATRAHGERSAAAARAINTLAWHLYSSGAPREAEPLFREALLAFDQSMGESSPQAVKARTNLAACLADTGALEEASSLAAVGRDGLVRLLGPRHVDAIYARHIAAYVLMQQSRFADAALAYPPILDDAAVVYGAEHPHTLYFQNNYAWCLAEAGRGAEAEPIFRRILAQRRTLLPEGHRYNFDSLRGLAVALLAQGNLPDAERTASEAHEACLRLHGPDVSETKELAKTLARIREAQASATLGKAGAAEPPPGGGGAAPAEAAGGREKGP